MSDALSDDKLGHLSTTSNNNISDFIPASYVFYVKMSVFEPKKHYFPEGLLYFFSVKKSTIELHRLLMMKLL